MYAKSVLLDGGAQKLSCITADIQSCDLKIALSRRRKEGGGGRGEGGLSEVLWSQVGKSGEYSECTVYIGWG